jgi:transcriptional regulator with XRE-family HTH domain
MSFVWSLLEATTKSLQPSISAVVRVMRLKKKWSQEELALAVGVKATEISHLESGRRNPKLVTLERLADGFGVRCSRMIEVAEELDAGIRLLEKGQA